MANVSSFFGYVFFRINGEPWTPEGFLLAYDVLKSQDSCGGAYGVCLDEEIATDSASFLADMLACKGEDPMIGYWGSGRWSALNNFESWDIWTKNKGSDQTMSDETYLATRTKLLELMAANEWYLQFDYTDEEGGSGYITREQVDIEAHKEADGTYKFTTSSTEVESYDYNLKNYALIVDEESRETSDRISEVLEPMCSLLQISKDEDVAMFRRFIIEQDWDDRMSPWEEFETRDAFPKGLTEAWEVYKNAKEVQ